MSLQPLNCKSTKYLLIESSTSPQQSVTTIPNKGVQFTPVSKRLTVPISGPPMKKTLSQSEISQTETKVLNVSQTESDVPIAPPRLRRKVSSLNAPITKVAGTSLDSSPIPPGVSPPPQCPPPKVSPRPPPPRVSPSSTKTNGSRHTLSSHETSQLPKQHRENKKPPLDPSLSVSLSSSSFQHNLCHTQRQSDATLGNKAETLSRKPRTRPVPPRNLRKSLISLPIHLINPPSRPIPSCNIPDPNFNNLRTLSTSDLTPQPQTTEPILHPKESFPSHTMTKIQSPRPPPVIRDLTKTTPPILRPKSRNHVTSEKNKNLDIYTLPDQLIKTENADDPDMIPWYASSVLKAINFEQVVQNGDPSSLSKDINSELPTASLSIPDNDTLPNNLTTNNQSGYVSLSPTTREEGE